MCGYRNLLQKWAVLGFLLWGCNSHKHKGSLPHDTIQPQGFEKNCWGSVWKPMKWKNLEFGSESKASAASAESKTFSNTPLHKKNLFLKTRISVKENPELYCPNSTIWETFPFHRFGSEYIVQKLLCFWLNSPYCLTVKPSSIVQNSWATWIYKKSALQVTQTSYLTNK